MPQVKKSPAGAGQPASSSRASSSANSRREVEQATERFETALGEANQALKTLARNVGKGAEVAYKERCRVCFFRAAARGVQLGRRRVDALLVLLDAP
jgi:hypothetical protein